MAGAQSARSTRWPRPLWRSACRLAPHVAITLAVSVCFAERTVAQSTPSVTIAATLEADAPSETPLEITVGPAASLPRGSIVRLYGLPPLAALSAGHSIAPGAWAIPVAALPNLKVMLPGAVSGKSQIKVTIVSSDGAILAEARSTLIVLPKVTPPPVAAPSVGSQTLPAGARSQPRGPGCSCPNPATPGQHHECRGARSRHAVGQARRRAACRRRYCASTPVLRTRRRSRTGSGCYGARQHL